MPCVSLPQPLHLEDKVVIPYVAAYGYTGELAQEVAKGVESAGIKAVVFDMVTAKKEDFMSEWHNAKGIILGSPTIGTLAELTN